MRICVHLGVVVGDRLEVSRGIILEFHRAEIDLLIRLATEKKIEVDQWLAAQLLSCHRSGRIQSN